MNHGCECMHAPALGAVSFSAVSADGLNIHIAEKAAFGLCLRTPVSYPGRVYPGPRFASTTETLWRGAATCVEGAELGGRCGMGFVRAERELAELSVGPRTYLSLLSLSLSQHLTMLSALTPNHGLVPLCSSPNRECGVVAGTLNGADMTSNTTT